MGNLLMLGVSLLSNWQRILVYAIVAAALAATIWMHGYFKGKAALYEYQAEIARQGVLIVTRQAKATERVITKYVKVREESKTTETAINKEVTQYAQTNPGFCLDAGWRWLHDAAAAHAVPDSARALDGAGGAPQAATALETVAENYGACHRTADRLDALQEWVREQQKIAR